MKRLNGKVREILFYPGDDSLASTTSVVNNLDVFKMEDIQ